MGRHPLAEWLDAGDAPPPAGGLADEPAASPRRRPRRWRVLALATLPWAIVGGVLIGASRSSDDDHPQGDGADQAVRDRSPGRAAPPSAGAAVRPEPPGHLAAAAAVAVRDHVNDSEGSVRRYVDLALPEGGESVGDAWVVGVVAVVLEGDEEAWVASHLRRFAVPVDATGQVLEAPWLVERPDEPEAGDDSPPPPALQWQPVDPDSSEVPGGLDAVAGALDVAGYTVRDLALEDSDDLPGLLRASFHDQDSPTTVWLSTDPDLRLIGAHPDPD